MFGAVFRRLAQPPSPPHPESARKVELDGEGVVEKVRCGAIVLRSPLLRLTLSSGPSTSLGAGSAAPTFLTLSSGEAAYRRSIATNAGAIACGAGNQRFAKPPSSVGFDLRYGAYAPAQDEGSGRLLDMRAPSVPRSPMPRGESIPTGVDFFNSPDKGGQGGFFGRGKSMTEKQEEPCWKRQERESREK